MIRVHSDTAKDLLQRKSHPSDEGLAGGSHSSGQVPEAPLAARRFSECAYQRRQGSAHHGERQLRSSPERKGLRREPDPVCLLRLGGPRPAYASELDASFEHNPYKAGAGELASVVTVSEALAGAVGQHSLSHGARRGNHGLVSLPVWLIPNRNELV